MKRAAAASPTREGRRSKSKDPLDLPDFLKVKNRVDRPMPEWVVNRSVSEVQKTAADLDPRLKGIPLWRLPKSALEDPVSREMFIEEHLERQRRKQDGLQKLHDRPRAPRKPNPFANLVSLKDILAGLENAPSPGTAKRAIEGAKLIHSKFHFTKERVQAAIDAIKSYEPARRTAQSFPDAARILVITKKNPRREGTGQHRRYALIVQYHNKTYAEYVAAGGRYDALLYAINGKHVKLENADAKAAVDRNEQPTVDRTEVRAVSSPRGVRGSPPVEHATQPERNVEEGVPGRVRAHKSGGRRVERNNRKAKRNKPAPKSKRSKGRPAR